MKRETITIQGAMLECYLHDEPMCGAKPAMIVCPGGGYHILTYDEGEPIAMRFYGEGYQAFVLHYPVEEAASWPNATVAALCCIARVRENAETWNIRPDAIGVIGFSAGAHVAATTGTYFDNDEVLAAGGKKEGRPDAMCLIYPVIGADMTKNKKNGSRLIIRCDERVTENTPPTFLATTYGDTVVSCDQSLNMASALSKHDVPFELHCFQPGNHAALNGGGIPGAKTSRTIGINSWFLLCTEWLRDLFGAEQSDDVPMSDDILKMINMTRDHEDYFTVWGAGPMAGV